MYHYCYCMRGVAQDQCQLTGMQVGRCSTTLFPDFVEEHNLTLKSLLHQINVIILPPGVFLNNSSFTGMPKQFALIRNLVPLIVTNLHCFHVFEI